MELRKVRYHDNIIEYELTVKPVKNINLRINTDGCVKVSANKYVSLSHIDGFVISHGEFILSAVDKLANRHEESKFVFANGARFRLHGEYFNLKILSSISNTVRLSGDELIIYSKKPADMIFCEKLFTRWYKEYTKTYFIDICHKVYPLFERYRIKFPEIRVRQMKTKWGSCQPHNGIITLNSNLMEKPEAGIEYVVLHEFAHFIVPNHSKAFYSLVEQLMSDYKERRKMLN